MRKIAMSVMASCVIMSQLLGAQAGQAQEPVASDGHAPRDAFYCQERRLGSWFYCDAEKQKKAREAKANTPAETATKQLASITKELDELKARAILEPTTENLTAYMTYQRQQLDRASTFADVWGRTVWQNPDLDYTIQRPINTLGKRTWMEERKSEKAQTMQSLSKRYGVFYFYSSARGACRVFGPIVRSVSDQYGLDVLAVSMDGGPNEAFPHYVVDTGQYEKMGLTGGTVPALVLFDTKTKRPIPIGYGLMAADEVMDRIFTLTKTKPGSDY